MGGPTVLLGSFRSKSYDMCSRVYFLKKRGLSSAPTASPGLDGDGRLGRLAARPAYPARVCPTAPGLQRKSWIANNVVLRSGACVSQCAPPRLFRKMLCALHPKFSVKAAQSVATTQLWGTRVLPSFKDFEY